MTKNCQAGNLSTASGAEIRDILYQYLLDNKVIDPAVIGNPSVIGKWSFVPENVVRPALDNDMKLLFPRR